MEPIEMFERAASRAADLAREVGPEQMTLPTPCDDWDVAMLLEHLATGPAYLMDALGTTPSGDRPWPDPSVVVACVAALRAPGALETTCMSPAGFEWTVADAAAGTAMDQLLHSWDLAVAVGADTTIDPELAAAIVAMFLPHMPEIGREAGIVGAAVEVPASASVQDRLLGAMGRDPRLAG